jgi:hypothetical protein
MGNFSSPSAVGTSKFGPYFASNFGPVFAKRHTWHAAFDASAD